MTSRRDRISEAERRARRQLAAILDDIHERRVAGGVRQADVASAVGSSRSWIGAIERGAPADVGIVELSRVAAAVGLDLAARTFDGPSVLRDAGQTGLLNRLRAECDPRLPWRLEVAVAPGDPRAFDAVLGVLPRAVAIEAITRLRDVQAQIRRAQSKQEVAGMPVLILLVGATHGNRRALREAGSQLRDAFPAGTRAVLGGLRRGEVPRRSGIVLI